MKIEEIREGLRFADGCREKVRIELKDGRKYIGYVEDYFERYDMDSEYGFFVFVKENGRDEFWPE